MPLTNDRLSKHSRCTGDEKPTVFAAGKLGRRLMMFEADENAWMNQGWLRLRLS